MLDTSLQPYSLNLFRLPPVAPQETRNLYYEAGVATGEFSRIGAADLPYSESFEQMMERIQKEARTEPSGAERGVSPGAESVESLDGTSFDDQPFDGTSFNGTNGTDYYTDCYKEDNAKKPGREEPSVTGRLGSPERSRAETDETGEKASLNEAVLGMVRPDVNEAAVENATGQASDALTGGDDAGGIKATAIKENPDPAFSLEDGILFTDTSPLFENKPAVQEAGFGAPVPADEASAPGLAEDTGVALASGNVPQGDAAGAARQNRGTKDAVSDSGEIPEPFEAPSELLDGHPQLVSFAEKGTRTESAVGTAGSTGKKKAESRKINLDVLDMRSSSGESAGARIGGPFAEGDGAKPVPVKDMTVDLKGALLGSPGDAPMGGSQMAAGFDQFNNADLKSTAQLESFLSRELHNGLNGDIVRQASVMLRDGGEGLIRLQLHPESLGNVRIKLSLSGSKVEGVITVESPEAMNAFERELESLEMAFRDSGFEGANLNMQMSGGNTSADLFDGVQAGAFSQVIAASSYESTAGTVTDGQPHSIYERGGLSIFA